MYDYGVHTYLAPSMLLSTPVSAETFATVETVIVHVVCAP